MTRVLSVVTYRMLLTIMVGIAIVAGMCMALIGSDADAKPGTRQVLVVWIPLSVAVISVVLATAIVRPWQFGRDMAAMRAGDAWAHWTYDDAAWAAANKVEGTRLRRTGYTTALISFGGALLVLLIWLSLDGENGSILRFTGGICTGAFLVAIAGFGGTSASVWARRRKRGDIYVSRTGIWRRPGGYMPLVGFGYHLRDVTLHEAEHTYVHFEMEVSGSTQGTDSWADVLVPAGREAEGRELVARFRRVSSRAARQAHADPLREACSPDPLRHPCPAGRTPADARRRR